MRFSSRGTTCRGIRPEVNHRYRFDDDDAHRAPKPTPPGPPPAHRPTSSGSPPPAQFAIEAARHFAATRCHNVVVLDMQGLCPITDYMVIGTGTSPPPDEDGRATSSRRSPSPKGHHKLSRSGDDSGQWIVIDFVDVVCHVFSPEGRMYYDLDNLWGDAKRVEWETGGEASSQ